MITDIDVKKLAKAFVTKDDLKNLATKDDLKAFATKTDIGQLSQKIDDLKTRIDTLEDNITGDIAKLQNENEVTATYNQRLNAVEAKLALTS